MLIHTVNSIHENMLISIFHLTALVNRNMEMMNASRCFNCDSYAHALKECPKPRDNAAVNNARKQFHANKNVHAGPRVPTRYYQDSPRGKFDGLKPGCLAAETRTLLGIGVLYIYNLYMYIYYVVYTILS